MVSKCTDRISAPEFFSVGYWWKETADVGSWHSSDDKRQRKQLRGLEL